MNATTFTENKKLNKLMTLKMSAEKLHEELLSIYNQITLMTNALQTYQLNWLLTLNGSNAVVKYFKIFLRNILLLLMSLFRFDVDRRLGKIQKYIAKLDMKIAAESYKGINIPF